MTRKKVQRVARRQDLARTRTILRLIVGYFHFVLGIRNVRKVSTRKRNKERTCREEMKGKRIEGDRVLRCGISLAAYQWWMLDYLRGQEELKEEQEDQGRSSRSEGIFCSWTASRGSGGIASRSRNLLREESIHLFLLSSSSSSSSISVSYPSFSIGQVVSGPSLILFLIILSLPMSRAREI